MRLSNLVLLSTAIGVAGCTALATGQLRKDHAAWAQYQPQIVGTPAERMESCAAKPFSTETAGDVIVNKYGLRKDFPGEALVYCVLTTHTQNGRVAKYFTQSGNPGGNTKGDQLCAYLIDRCYGNGALVANAGNSEGLITVFASERDVRDAAMWTRSQPTQPSEAMQMLTLMMSAKSARDQAQASEIQPAAARQQQTAAPAQQSAEAQLAEAQRQIDQLKSQLQQQQQQQPANSVVRAPVSQPAIPAPARSRPPPRSSPESQLQASVKHGARYESDGSGGLLYVVFVQNDGQVVVSCDVRVRALVWNAGGGPQNLQSEYNDRRRVVVYPAREGTAGFNRVVANSGAYEVTCERG